MIQALVLLSFLGLLVFGPIAARRIDAWLIARQRRARVRRVEFVARLLELRVCARWGLRCRWSSADDRGCIAIEGEAPDRYLVGREVRAVLAEFWLEQWGHRPRLDVRVRDIEGFARIGDRLVWCPAMDARARPAHE